MLNKILAISLLTLVIAPVTSRSLERVQADVRVESVTVAQPAITLAGPLRCKVKVSNQHDDNAHDATLKILLPVGVRFLRTSIGRCSASSAFHDGTQGVVTCNLGEIAVGDSKTVEIITTLPSDNGEKKFGAFVWSRTPDPIPANNYGEGKP